MPSPCSPIDGNGAPSSEAVHKQEQWLVILVAVLIGVRYLWALSYTTKPIPASYHPGNDAVVTSAAILRRQHGFNALQVVAPPEGRVELRLHSWLTVPLLAFGYTEGGRLVAWVASLLSVVVVFLIGWSMWGKRVGAISAFLLAVSPTFTLFSYHILPENLSVLLTCLAMLLTIWPGSLTWQRCLSLLVIFSLAALNHIWEVTILFPLIVVLLRERRAYGPIISLLGLGTLLSLVNVAVFGTNYFRVDPSQQHHIQAYSFLFNAHLFLSPSWWLPLDRWRSFPGLVASGYFLLALGGVLYLTWLLVKRTGGNKSLLLASWLISGLIPIFLLPRHYIGHDYSVWGTLAPVSLGLALMADRLLSRLNKQMTAILLVGLTVLSLAFLFVADQRLRDQPYPFAEKLDIREAGVRLSRYTEDHEVQRTEVAILVEESRASEIARSYFKSHSQLAYFLIYSNLIPVYWDSMDQAVTDNIPTSRFSAPDVVGDLTRVPNESRILVSTQMVLAQYPEWQNEYRRLLDVVDVVVLERR